jgi:hypothetical protein
MEFAEGVCNIPSRCDRREAAYEDVKQVARKK